jgi:hypothetical protein
MARGNFDLISKEIEKQERRRQEQGALRGVKKFNLQKPGPGEEAPTAQVRFLDGDGEFEYCWTHPVETITNWGKRTKHIPCLDQNDDGNKCPGCEANLKKVQRFWINLIWRDAPVYERTDKGINWNKVISNEDQIFVWTSGQSLFKILKEAQKDFGSLTDQDFILERTTEQWQPYKLPRKQPEPSPMSPADKKLAADKYDLLMFSKLPSYEDFAAEIPGFSSPSRKREHTDDDEDMGSLAGRTPFGKKSARGMGRRPRPHL